MRERGGKDKHDGKRRTDFGWRFTTKSQYEPQKVKKGERTAEGEQSSLTVNGVMKEGGQTASDGL